MTTIRALHRPLVVALGVPAVATLLLGVLAILGGAMAAVLVIAVVLTLATAGIG